MGVEEVQEGARGVQEGCKRGARGVQEWCRRGAGGVQEGCRRGAGGVQEGCRRGAGGVQEGSIGQSDEHVTRLSSDGYHIRLLNNVARCTICDASQNNLLSFVSILFLT